MTAENLVLITIDALRHDALSCVGSPYASTPNLDTLAAGGALFEQAISNGPRTQSSFPSIMTSLYPLAAGERRRLPTRATTVAETIKNTGLTTAAFNPSNPFLTRETGYDRGFDLFIDFWDVHERTGAASSRRAPARLKKAVHDAVGRRSLGFLMLMQALLLEEGGQYLSGRSITDHALAWIGDREGRFFLWLHFMDVHYPYQPLQGRRRWTDRLEYLRAMVEMCVGRPGPAVAALRGLYGERVELVDAFVGDLVRGLHALGRADDTAVVVTSDHGEQLGDHGRWAHGPDLHDELIRVPLIVSGPGISPARRIEDQVELLGLAPTVLELLGVKAPPSFLGTSFAPLAVAGTGEGARIVFSEAMHSGNRQSRIGVRDTMTVRSCRTDGWKYIHDDERDSEELYDLTTDPREETDLIATRIEKADELRDLTREHAKTVEGLAAEYQSNETPQPSSDDEELRRRLAALGYL